MKYFDLHCDTVTECWKKKESLRKNSLCVSLEKGRSCENWAQIFAVWMDDTLAGEEAWNYFSSAADFFTSEMEKNTDIASFCHSGQEIRKAAADGKEIALLSIEGSRALGGKIEHLEDAWKTGVRLITLTWNGRCEAADGCQTENAGGLTPFGFELVHRMNESGIIVDVSHLSEKGFWDVARTARKPFAATHSDAKAICDHVRNLTDEQFREIAQGGGIVGMNFYREFLHSGSASTEDFLRHIDHFLHLGGEKTIALGSDFDGCELMDGVHGLEDIGGLYSLVKREFGAEITDAVFYGNAFRFFTENLN